LLLVVAGLVLGCKARSSPRQVILDAIVAAERAVEEKGPGDDRGALIASCASYACRPAATPRR
jgi:hypothetical protein